ncbi:MAG: DUF3108 domain-containing protein [Candidatus Cloacimonadota bacterium]|nr:DUF3108 domain-containing protein [Candidatus Cloacimonadota bacterium]
MELLIRYLGIPVVKVLMHTTEDSVWVHAKSTKLASIAANMDNIYTINYQNDFIPKKYRKKIDQKDYSENRITYYDRENMIARRISKIDSAKNTTYNITADTRDFFSALSFLRFTKKSSGTITLDANRLLWQANYKSIKKENLKTSLGKIDCNKYEIEFVKDTKKNRERSDMLTNNLVDEDKKLYLWITDDSRGIPVKAQFKMSPFSVYWFITQYENL